MDKWVNFIRVNVFWAVSDQAEEALSRKDALIAGERKLRKGQAEPASRSAGRKKRMYEALRMRQDDLTLVLDNIHDPHNVSAIFRSCDAFGVSRAYLYYSTAPFPRLGKKTSASAIKWVEARRADNAEKLFSDLKNNGFQTLTTGFSEKARPLRQWDFLRPVAVILGNEHSGASPELVSRADGEIYIPMHGLIRSFNVSVAAAIILAEAARQREDAGWYDDWRFSERDFHERYENWLKK